MDPRARDRARLSRPAIDVRRPRSDRRARVRAAGAQGPDPVGLSGSGAPARRDRIRAHLPASADPMGCCGPAAPIVNTSSGVSAIPAG